MDYLLYLMFRCDRRCDGKFGNFVGTKHTLGIVAVEDPKIYRGDDRCLYVRGTGTSVFDAICFASKSNVLYSLGNH